jgi:hypothetical protein
MLPFEEEATVLPFEIEARIPGSAPPIFGMDKDKPSLGEKVIGGLEAATTIASSIPSMLYGSAVGLSQAARGGDGLAAANQSIQANTFQPRTEVGQDYAQAADEVFQQLFPNLVAMTPRVAPVRRGKAPDVLPPKPVVETAKPLPFEMTNELAQFELFDQPEMGRVANPYEAKLGDWRVDENGIPIKADLSMDVQNASQPLQRNLWGDELEQTRNPVGQNADLEAGIRQMTDEGMQEGIPLTEAIDSMDWIDKRHAINTELKGEVKVSPELEAALAESKSPFPPPSLNRGLGRRQGGAVNMDVFDAAYVRTKELANGLKLVLWGGDSPTVTAYRGTNQVGELQLSPDAWMREPTAGDNLKADWVDTSKSQKPGLAKEMYQFAAEIGNDIIPSNIQTDAGKAMWDRFEKQGVSQGGMIRGQRGGIDVESIREAAKNIKDRLSFRNGEKGPKVVAPSTPRKPTTPEDIQVKQKYRENLKATGNERLLSEWTDVDTFEEATALAADAKDISTTQAGQAVASGINMMAAYHNNPLLKYGRKLFMDSRAYTVGYTREFITNRTDGLATLVPKMKPNERIQVMELLLEGGRTRTDISPEIMRENGLTDVQQQFITKYQQATARALEDWNAIRVENGLKSVTRLPGYFPGVFRGDFKSVVMQGDRVIGVITADTRGQFTDAKNYVLKNFPGAKLLKDTPIAARRQVTGNYNRSFVNKDYLDLLAMLSEADPKFGEIQAAIDGAIVQSSKDLFNFDVHSLQKKGVFGSEGNKPWLDRRQNAKEAMDTMIRFLEEGAEYRAMQRPSIAINKLIKAPEVQHMPNTLAYMTKYLDNAVGSYTNDAGQIINKLFDVGSKLAENIPVFGTKYIGPTNLLMASNWTKNHMSHMYMGWLNWMFTMSQFAQPVQTGLPFLMLASDRLGLGPMYTAKIPMIGARAGTDMVKLRNEELGFLKNVEVSPLNREAYEYAKQHGMSDFSELERAYEGNKTAIMREADKFAEYNMALGERYTRAPMFMTFANILVDGGIPKEKAFKIAEHMTGTSMIDYHKFERPMLYSGLGVLGQHAGGLTTFKHGFLGQQALLAKEVGRSHNVAPLATSALAMVGFAGLLGFPFFNDIDELYGIMSNQFFGERKSLTEGFLENQDTWLKYGLVSDAMGLNMQGKFSAADMVPDSVGKAMFPHLSGAFDIGAAAIDAAKTGDEQAWANLAVALTPAGMKKNTEYLTRRDEEGNLLDKNRNVVTHRTPEEWKGARLTGLTPLNEAEKRNDIFRARDKMQADKDAQKSIAERFSRAVRNNESPEELKDILMEYRARKGNPVQLINRIADTKIKQRMTEELRMSGIPTSDLSSIERYKYFNR